MVMVGLTSPLYYDLESGTRLRNQNGPMLPGQIERRFLPLSPKKKRPPQALAPVADRSGRSQKMAVVREGPNKVSGPRPAIRTPGRHELRPAPARGTRWLRVRRLFRFAGATRPDRLEPGAGPSCGVAED